MNKKGIFLTFEGISDTIFDSQVALHVKEMKEKGIELDIITFETWPGLYKKSSEQLERVRSIVQTKVNLYRGVFIYIPFSEIINAIMVFIVILRLKNKPQFIHARADYAASMCVLASRVLKIPYIWDCRGDTEAEFRSAFKANNVFKRIFKHITLGMINYHAYVSAKNCSKAIFVTDLLRQRKGKPMKNNESIIIPTSASSTTFYFSEKLRQTMRKKLGFSNEQQVLIYSGGMVGYQNFPEYVRIFKALYDLNSHLHFMVVTPDTKRANIMLESLIDKSYSLISATFEDMNSLYNASDFGILLRENNDVNNVASPTKFSEYCLSGLPIIMNDSVKQSYLFALQIGNLIPYNENLASFNLIRLEASERYVVGRKAIQILSRECNMEKYTSIYAFSN